MGCWAYLTFLPGISNIWWETNDIVFAENTFWVILLDYNMHCFSGLVKDDTLTLEAVKIVNNAKVMVVGSTPKDIDSVKTPAAQDLKEERQAGGISYIIFIYVIYLYFITYIMYLLRKILLRDL